MYFTDVCIEPLDGEDSAFVSSSDQGTLFCLADGAGGIAGGKEASIRAIEACQHFLMNTDSDRADDYEKFLRELDLSLFQQSHCGETTIILGKVINNNVVGASIGDSQAWLISELFDYELTSLQIRKPLLGSGKSIPIGFGPMALESSFILGSDGLFNYAEFHQIRKKLMINKSIKAKEILDLAKTKNGKRYDDASVITIKKHS